MEVTTEFKYNEKGELECYDKNTGEFLGIMETMGDLCSEENENKPRRHKA